MPYISANLIILGQTLTYLTYFNATRIQLASAIGIILVYCLFHLQQPALR